MEISTIILLALVIASCVLNLVVLSKLGKISKQLSTPIVKKLAPEIKLKNVKRQPKSESGKPQRNQRKAKEPSENNEKATKGGRNRNQSRNRNRNRPAPEVFSNDALEQNDTQDIQSKSNTQDSQQVAAVSVNETAPVQKTKTETVREAAPEQSNNRPSLAPRGEAPDSPVSDVPKAFDSVPQGDNSDAEKSIRHGRRAQVKR